MSRYIYNVILIASALIFCLPVFSEEQKTKISIKDPECGFESLSVEDYSRLSKVQNLLFDEALKLLQKRDLTKAELALKRTKKIYGQHRELYKILSQVQNALGKKDESESSMTYYLHL
jgi:hypothetical protein